MFIYILVPIMSAQYELDIFMDCVSGCDYNLDRRNKFSVLYTSCTSPLAP